MTALHQNRDLHFIRLVAVALGRSSLLGEHTY